MSIASVVFEHKFDKAMLEQIDSLRTIRLNVWETMLQDLTLTADELQSRGLAEQLDATELRKELMDKIAVLRERLKQPEVVYEDEISLYVDLLDSEFLAEETDD